MTDLLSYIREGFWPQNAAFHGAGDPADGSPNIGAVDPTPSQAQLSVEDAELGEGDGGTGTLTLDVSLSSPAEGGPAAPSER